MKKIKLNKIDIVLSILVLVVSNTFCYLKIFTYKSEPILMNYASSKTTNIITNLMNNSIRNVLYKENYKDIIIIEKDSKGYVSNLSFDNKKTNELLYLITNNVLENMESIEKSNFINKNDAFYIPMGVLFDIPAIANIGPRIPFDIEYLGNINSDVTINIKEYGINSSLVELKLFFSLQLQVVFPFRSNVTTIKRSIIIDSKIAQGYVPEYYGGLLSNAIK